MIEMFGTIKQVYPSTTFGVELENGHEVLAHIAGRLRRHHIKLLLGDRVELEISPYDLTKGRIIYRYRAGEARRSLLRSRSKPSATSPNSPSPTIRPRSSRAGSRATWPRACFTPRSTRSRPPFIISMPPPNITGAAHIGHGSTYTPMDVLTRYHRMRGENADWLPGQDHAAIATEAVLVRELAKEDLTRDGMGRDAFLARAWKWREQYGNRINEQFKRLGFGPDWQRERFTMDPQLSAAVTKVFVDLYREGLIYRGTRLVNWDPEAPSRRSPTPRSRTSRTPARCGTFATAPKTAARASSSRRHGPKHFSPTSRSRCIPDDERYAALIGKQRRAAAVEPAGSGDRRCRGLREFGTGAVKVTPAHDTTDYEIGQRHGLPMPTVIDYDGRIIVPAWRIEPDAALRARFDVGRDALAKYVGLDRFAARTAIVADLEAAGALVRVEPYESTVPVSSRSGEIIEPLLSLQWFWRWSRWPSRRSRPTATGAVRFVPERFGRTYEHGLENLRDWNISRQVWWGHQLPGLVHARRRRHRRARCGRSARRSGASGSARSSCAAIPTRSTRGFPAACGRSRFWVGRIRRPNSRPGIPTK